MPTIKVKADNKVIEAVMLLIGVIEAAAGRTEAIEVEIEQVDPVVRNIAPRVHYVANLPAAAMTDPEVARQWLKDKLDAIGEVTIMGVILSDIVSANLEGKQVTERQLREQRGYNTKSVQRSLVMLRKGTPALVRSEPIINT